jgi:PAS domain S-box-containing protein
MKLKTLWIAAVALSVLAVAVFALALTSAVNDQQAIIDLQKERADQLQLAQRLRQSSDDLTRMARNFAVTGDSRYEALYERAAAVRDGKQPRPPGDASAHWDLLLGGVEPPKGEGERIALADELARAKLAAKEQEFLKRALAAQADLATLEAAALAAMKGQATGAEGAAPGQPDPVRALKILYGDEYLAAKGRSQQALSALYDEIDLRTRGALGKTVQSQAHDLQLNWIVLVAFAIAGAATLLYTLWRGLLPLLALRRHAGVLVNGDYAQRSDVRGVQEIQDLMRGLNHAATRLEAGAKELDERDRYLEALLRTSPLGLVLVDAKQRVRWTSRRLRDFLGDSKQDLKQMPFDEFFADPAELAAFRDALERKGRVRELIARIRRRDGTEFRARLDSAYVERSAERLAAVWVQAFGLHGQKTDGAGPEAGS